jgi:alpha-D-ribose 1-methylphosphonate 5-triphosphate synthase subunit PhnL
MIVVEGLEKTFTLHMRGGIELAILNGLDLTVRQGEVVVLTGPSGVGKSTLLRCIYANYLAHGGQVRIRHEGRWVDVSGASPSQVIAVRQTTVGYVSQFLRVLPRIATLNLVAEPLRTLGCEEEEARERAARLLTRLRIPEQLWSVPPATFSGGEQQRVNIARTFVVEYPILLLDEPTAALDAKNRETVVGLIDEARERGAAIVGIFHDADVRRAVGTRELDLSRSEAAA